MAAVAPPGVRPSPRWFLAALALGLLVRVVILTQTTGLGARIADEQQYRQIAHQLLDGNGFAFAPDQPTSLRPPLYPAFLAATWWLTGRDSFQAVRLLQFAIALATTALVYALARRVFDARAARLAAAAFWLYPGLIFANALLLTETMFTFWLVAFLFLLVRLIQREPSADAWPLAIGAGAALGFSALTRSVLWPLPIVLCPLLVWLLAGSWKRRIALPSLLFAGFVAVIGPWAIRNTRLQGVTTVIDTMGGMNLRMGNYEHTPDDRMWDAVSLRGDRNWVHGIGDAFPDRLPTEGEKDKWAQRKAIEYILANPATTLRRDLIKFADFWGLEREFLAGVRSGLFHPPRWGAVVGAVAMLLTYPLLVLSASLGAWLTRASDWRVHMLLLLPVAAIAGVHTIVFGHSRYHVPLVPILAVLAAPFWIERRAAWRSATRWTRAGAVLTALTFIAIWLRQIVLVDLARIQALF
jgi:4-amino-4-deoxy-L-arabinose transferase-like glycosyltransferase